MACDHNKSGLPWLGICVHQAPGLSRHFCKPPIAKWNKSRNSHKLRFVWAWNKLELPHCLVPNETFAQSSRGKSNRCEPEPRSLASVLVLVLVLALALS